MEIKKENYSAKPWRLLDRNGYEVRLPVQFDHPDLGMTTILQSISGDFEWTPGQERPKADADETAQETR